MSAKPKIETEIADSNEVETVETIDDNADDSAEILQDAEELAKDGQTEVKENETHEESVRQALKDLSKNASDGVEDSQNTKEVSKAPDVAVNSQVKTSKTKEARFDPELLPPDQLKLEHKELFNKLPENLRRETNRLIKGMQAEMTRAQQESAKTVKDWSGLEEAVRPFAQEFGRMGLTVPQGVVTLLSAHSALTNPKTSLQAYIALGKDLGHDTSSLESQSEEAGNISLSQNPEFRAMQEENKRLREMVEPLHNGVKQSQEQRDNAIVESITTELQSVINKMDGSGRYANPKLHEPEFLEAWKQLTAAIARTDKSVKSWAEAGQVAHDRMLGKSSSNGSVQPSSRNNRSVSAAISTRGRNVAPVVMAQEEADVPMNETPEQSARAALAELRRGL